MKIEGQKYLNKNNYTKIVMNLLGCEYKVRVKCDKDYETIKDGYSFTDDLKNLNDQEKVTEIVEHFLRNSKLNEIKESRYNGYTGIFSIAMGSNGRQLAIKLPKNELGESIAKKIIDKYYHDRKGYFLNNEIKVICFSDMIKNYYYGENTLCLFGQYGELNENEAYFLEQIILDKLDYNHQANIEFLDIDSGIAGVHYSAPHLICGDLKIRIGSYVVARNITEIATKYNQELKKEKEKQLVLKGWKTYGKYYNN